MQHEDDEKPKRNKGRLKRKSGDENTGRLQIVLRTNYRKKE